MREIKFRGKRLDNGEWVYGYYYRRRTWNDKEGQEHYILTVGKDITYEVDTETVGEYTGLKDKNGKEIYKGDKIGLPYVNPMGDIDDKYDPNTVYPVVYKHGCFGFERVNFQPLLSWLKEEKGEYVCNFGNKIVVTNYFYGEVIGNIYDNPELLNETSDNTEGE